MVVWGIWESSSQFHLKFAVSSIENSRALSQWRDPGRIARSSLERSHCPYGQALGGAS